jgi:tetratricopeptide (TPR) repeat protein
MLTQPWNAAAVSAASKMWRFRSKLRIVYTAANSNRPGTLFSNLGDSMKTTRSKTSGQRVPRRWRTPPPLTRGSESLEGMEILREVPGEAGALLWQAYRNVMFWASVEQGERAALFSENAAANRRSEIADARLPEELREPLTVLTEMIGAADETSGEAVADACTAIARWAETEGHLNAALAYTQAASVSAQRNARLALAVGQLARRRGDMARAETWFRHTIMVGRQVGDWDSYSRAYIALGNMLISRGNLPAAARMHIKALRAARRKGLQQIQGMALHDLFVIADEMGRDDQAEEYARQAFRAYGPSHPRLPLLAHDIAYFWMQRGHFAHALEIFQRLEPHVSEPADPSLLTANIARAAGGVGRSRRSTGRRGRRLTGWSRIRGHATVATRCSSSRTVPRPWASGIAPSRPPRSRTCCCEARPGKDAIPRRIAPGVDPHGSHAEVRITESRKASARVDNLTADVLARLSAGPVSLTA